MPGDTKHPDDPGLYLDNVAQQVKRIRHHASLAHWVCSNESTEVDGIEHITLCESDFRSADDLPTVSEMIALEPLVVFEE